MFKKKYLIINYIFKLPDFYFQYFVDMILIYYLNTNMFIINNIF